MLIQFPASASSDGILELLRTLSTADIIAMRKHIYAISPNKYFSHANPLENRGDHAHKVEMGDAIWNDFSRRAQMFTHVLDKMNSSSST